MKEIYVEAKMDIIEFECEDIITDSTPIAPLDLFEESDNYIE